MHHHLRCAATAALSVLAAAVGAGQTTTLPFDGITYLELLGGYGDRVSGPSTGGFSYGGSGTYTPNVEVAFGSTSSGLTGLLHTWTVGYNDLVNVIYTPAAGPVGSGTQMVLTFVADPGYRATLHAFDIGNWGAAITLPYVRVTDESGAVLFEEFSVALAPSTSPLERNFVLNPAPAGQILTLHVSVEGLAGNSDNVGLDNVTYGQAAGPTLEIGTTYCAPAVANSSGAPGRMRVYGTNTVAANDVLLLASSLPHASFGFFLASRTQGTVAMPGGSQGTLCLAGAIGRIVGPGEILNSGPQGLFELPIDLTLLPNPAGPVAALPGETWNFQAWYRDVNPTTTSNFTDAVSLVLQ